MYSSADGATMLGISTGNSDKCGDQSGHREGLKMREKSTNSKAANLGDIVRTLDIPFVHGSEAQPKAFSMSFDSSSGFVWGAKRSRTLPSRPIKNLVKFHLMASVPSTPGAADFMNS